MKQARIIASVILAVAVLVAAYATGRLIRQARMHGPESETQQVAEANDVNEPTLDDKAKIDEKRSEKLAEMSKLTEEERQRRRDEMLRGKRGEPGQVPRLSPEELAEMSEKWPEMSEEERAAFRAHMRGLPGREAQVAEPNAVDEN